MNGHFASVGNEPGNPASFEHGVQVIDEEKEFKYTRDSSFDPRSRANIPS